jgi:hypothetical protein
VSDRDDFAPVSTPVFTTGRWIQKWIPLPQTLMPLFSLYSKVSVKVEAKPLWVNSNGNKMTQMQYFAQFNDFFVTIHIGEIGHRCYSPARAVPGVEPDKSFWVVYGVEVCISQPFAE